MAKGEQNQVRVVERDGKMSEKFALTKLHELCDAVRDTRQPALLVHLHLPKAGKQ